MLQSLITYSLFSAALMWLGTISAKREKISLLQEKKLSFWTWDIIFALFVFSFISGIRWNVGVDHLSYLEQYNNFKDYGYFTDNFEPGFKLITRLFAFLNSHFTIYFGFLAFMQIFFMYYAFKDERYLLPYLGLVIIMGPHYLSWMNGIRQMIAATIFVFSIQFIQKRKLLLYVITILLASTIHKSAVLLIILYFIPQKNYFKNRYINVILLLITIIIGRNPAFLQASEFISNILSFIGYEGYSENLGSLIENKRIMTIGPRYISILLLNIVTIWYAPKLISRFNNTCYLIYFNLAFFGILMFNLFSNTDFIFLRPVSYFTIFLAPATAYLLYYFKPKNIYVVSVRFVIIFFIAVAHIYLSIIAENDKGVMDSTNFKFFWNYL